MKKFKILNIISLLIILFLSCRKPDSRLEGIYVNQLEDEYSIAWDTIAITRLDGSETTFKIEKRTGYQRFHSGKKMPKAYKNKTWTVSWDENRKAFNESLYWPPIRLVPEGLLLKSTAYRKVR